MKKIKVKWCKLAEDEHGWEKRFYCHTFHKKNTICACRSFFDLPDKYFYGVLLHELGHLLIGKNGDEEDANSAAFREFGVMIFYASKTAYGNKLEYIPIKKIQGVEIKLRSLLSFF